MYYKRKIFLGLDYLDESTEYKETIYLANSQLLLLGYQDLNLIYLGLKNPKSLLLLCEKYNAFYCVFKGLFHVFVPKCVDEWIQRRGDGSCEHRHHFVDGHSFLD